MEKINKTINASQLKVISCLQKKGYKILDSSPINNGRYLILRAIDLKSGKHSNFLVVFKREFYMTFGREFAQEGESGIGETLNKEDLRNAVLRGVKDIIFTYQNEAVYYISVSNFLKLSHERTNKFEEKVTKSINIKYLERLD